MQVNCAYIREIIALLLQPPNRIKFRIKELAGILTRQLRTIERNFFCLKVDFLPA